MLEDESADRRAERMSGCAVLGKGILRILTFLAFTVIVILLVWPLIPSHCLWGPSQSRLDKLKTQLQMHSLASALKYFHTEYNKLPLQSDTDLSTTTSEALILPLLGQDQTTNPRNIKFVDLPIAKDGRFGISGDPPTLIDSWGQPYHIILDTNKDGIITNPETAVDSRAEPTLKAHAAIYSSGPDRDPNTWQDNITTWR